MSKKLLLEKIKRVNLELKEIVIAFNSELKESKYNEILMSLAKLLFSLNDIEGDVFMNYPEDDNESEKQKNL
jgi:hypothetical protein